MRVDLPEMEERDRDKMGTEWVTICALREVINIAKRGKIDATYYKALSLAEELMPEHFAPERRTLLGVSEGLNARYFRQLAKAETELTGVHVEPLELAMKEQKKLTDRIDAAAETGVNVDLLKAKSEQIEFAISQLKPRRYTEHKMIFGNLFQAERDLPVSHDGRDYKQWHLEKNRVLRLRVLHPDPSEYKTGADVIYEHLDEKKKKARVAVIQFKLWDGKSFHQDPRMMGQMAKIEKFTCGSRLCDFDDDPRRTYRLPHCAAFLRPTDRLQSPNAKMLCTGKHIPLCVVKDAWESNSKGGKSIRKSSVADRSLAHDTFEHLFNTRMAGSKEMSYGDLEALYKSFQVLEQDDTVQVHAQEFLL